MARYNNTDETVNEIRKRFSCYFDIPCDSDDRRVQEIIGIVIQTIESQPTVDVVPRAEVASEIVEDVKATLLDYHLQEHKKYLKSLSKTKKQFEIETTRCRAITEAIKFALKTLNEIEKKYAEDKT